MSQSQFSLVWNSHQNNISNGLSTLQQNGEFVDMTLAADGHMVKVHQIIIALASPYLKDLLSSTQCPHPVIFLNNISFTTLSSILEYIYTGEVMISVENLNELIEAGKALHIKGLEDMKIQETTARIQEADETRVDSDMRTLDEENIQYYDVEEANEEILGDNELKAVAVMSGTEDTYETDCTDDKTMIITNVTSGSDLTSKPCDKPSVNVVQYTVSNQGSLQMILNRYVYYLKHCNRGNTRQWRCVDYLNSTKCPAHVFTRGDVVVKRISAHVHPFHDKKILKKIRAGTVFSAISEAAKKSYKSGADTQISE